MSAPLEEGRAEIEGLLEGALRDPNAEAILRAWIERQRNHGLHFELEIDGGRFDLTPRLETPLQLDAFPEGVSTRLARELEGLAAALDPDTRRTLFSTLRSREIVPGEALETLFPIAPPGRFVSRSRRVPTKTIAPSRARTWRQRLRRHAVSLVLIALLLATAPFVFDFEGAYRRVRATLSPRPPGSIALELGTCARWLRTAGLERSANALLLHLEATEALPRTKAHLVRELEKLDADPRARFALQTLDRGYVRFEYFDTHDRFLGSVERRIREIHEHPRITIALPAFLQDEPARIALVP